MKKLLKTPKFKNEEEERAYFLKLDLTEHFEPADFQKVLFPNLKPTTRPISIRLPDMLLNRVKERAIMLSVPYQSLIKQYIEQGVRVV